jgi:hypothetical protein
MGILVTSLPRLLQGAIVLLIFLSIGGPGTTSQKRAAWGAAGIAWLLLTVLLDWLVLLLMTVLFGLFVLLWRRLRWQLELPTVMAVVIVTLLDVPAMWLPPEQLRFVDREPLVAYVLSADGEWLTLLTEHDRRILVTRQSNVSTRTVCNLQPINSSRTISQVILGESGTPNNPDCPTVEPSRPAHQDR